VESHETVAQIAIKALCHAELVSASNKINVLWDPESSSGWHNTIWATRFHDPTKKMIWGCIIVVIMLAEY